MRGGSGAGAGAGQLQWRPGGGAQLAYVDPAEPDHTAQWRSELWLRDVGRGMSRLVLALNDSHYAGEPRWHPDGHSLAIVACISSVNCTGGGPGAPNFIILEKPESSEEFRAVARSYVGNPPSTVSGLVVTNLRTGARARGVDVVEIRFGSPFPDSTLETLEAEGDVFYCAGGIMVEHALVEPHIEAMGGTQDSVFGLPRDLLLKLLAEVLGVSG